MPHLPEDYASCLIILDSTVSVLHSSLQRVGLKGEFLLAAWILENALTWVIEIVWLCGSLKLQVEPECICSESGSGD
jgi:hypothetical protein